MVLENYPEETGKLINFYNPFRSINMNGSTIDLQNSFEDLYASTSTVSGAILEVSQTDKSVNSVSQPTTRPFQNSPPMMRLILREHLKVPIPRVRL